MANGTIAFDTLSTSGQISGTAKSLDTDFVVSGSAKSWIEFKGTSTTVILSSFTTSSIADNGTGSTTIVLSITMGSANFSATGSAIGSTSGGVNRVLSLLSSQGGTAKSTTGYGVESGYGYNAGNAAVDVENLSVHIMGDLA